MGRGCLIFSNSEGSESNISGKFSRRVDRWERGVKEGNWRDDSDFIGGVAGRKVSEFIK